VPWLLLHRAHAINRFVVIQPDYPSMGGMAEYNFLSSAFASGTMKAVFDNMRAIDVLESLT
jgi:hypothetical protein